MRSGIDSIIHEDTQMLNDRRRLLELALESLEGKKKQIDEEIAAITRELRGKPEVKVSLPKPQKAAVQIKAPKKQARFSKQEKLRRSQRMKEYWDNWRKKRAHSK
jgi:hypothetical protein